MSAVDGSIRIDTKLDTKQATKNINGLYGTISKLGGLIASVFAITKLVEFGKASIELASDLEEVQNVVDTAFGSMADRANAFAQSALKNFGMSELAAKQYSSTFMSMARSMGLSLEDATNMSLALTGLVGDVASFYNISQELAASKLRGVFTGETEALKDLGVVMTQANLEAFAMSKGITTSISEMSQAEQVALRYQYVTEALSLAQGDFARTSDSWANQIRVLQETLKSLSGIVGEFLIKWLTPAVQKLNEMAQALLNVAQAAKSVFFVSEATEEVADTATEAADAQEGVTEAVEETGKAIAGNVASFDELNIMNDASTGSDGDSGAAGLLEGLPTEEDIAIDEVTDAEVSPTLLSTLEKLRDILTPIVALVKELATDVGGGLKSLYESVISPLLSLLSSGLIFITNSLQTLYDGAIKPIVSAIGQSLLPRLRELIDLTSEYFSGLVPLISALVDKLSPALVNIGTTLASLAGDILGGMIERTRTVTTAILELVNALLSGDDAGSAFANFAEDIKGYITSTIESITGFFSENGGAILDVVKGLISGVVDAISTYLPMVADAAAELISWLISGISEALPKLAQAASNIIKSLCSYLTQSGVISQLIQAAVQIVTSLSGGIIEAAPLLIESAIQLISTLATGLIECIPMLVEAAVELILSLAEALVEGDLLDTIIESALTIMLTLCTALVDAIPQLIQAAVQLILSLVEYFTNPDTLQRIIEVGIQIVFALIDGLIQAIPQLIAAIPQLISAIWDTFTNVNWLKLGKNILVGIGNGIKNAVSSVVNVVKDACNSIWTGIKNFFGIHSPSTLMRDTVGNNIAAGIGVGFADEIDSVSDEMQAALGDSINADALATEIDLAHSVKLPTLDTDSMVPVRVICAMSEEESTLLNEIKEVTEDISDDLKDIKNRDTGSDSVTINADVGEITARKIVEVARRENVKAGKVVIPVGT